MAKTLIEVRQQIEGLKAVEEKLRREEAQGVIARIREAISVYGLTRADLFGGPSAKVKAKAPKARSSDATAKYSDGQGNTWSGRGRRPMWLSAALDSGKSIDQFAVATGKGSESVETPSKSPSKSKPTVKRKEVAAKYKDGDNAWSGRGSQPRWIKAALAEGKRLEDLAVKA